ncbi:PKD domain-containing protein [Fibrobacterota bacterium]
MCTEYPDDNPYDEDYDGDYFLTIVWESLPGTLGSFIDYTVPYTASTGKDSLFRYVIHDTLNDTVALIDYNDSTLHLYFVKEDSGDISIKGYALNGKEVISNDTTLNIINPFLVFPLDTVIYGKQFRCFLTVFDMFSGLFTKNSTDSVIWSYSVYNTYDTLTKSIIDTIAFPVTSLDSIRIRFRFKDEKGYLSREIYRSFNVKKYPPSVNAPDDTLMTRVGNVLLPIKFSDENDKVDSAFFMLRDTIVTRKKLEFPDTATISVFTGFEPITEMLYTWVKDQSGLTSNIDSTFLITTIPDNDKPFIRVYNQNEDTIKTASDSVEVLFLAWDNWPNGVKAVTCTTEANKILSGIFQDTINDSTIWKVTITDLPFRQTFSAKACAIDSFNNVSPCTTFYMYFDPTFSDITPPKISLIYPDVDSMRVYADTFRAEFTVTDLVDSADTIDDGIDSVYYEINGTFAGTATKVDSIYTFFDTLPQFNLNTITIVARDSSACHNKATYPFKLFYNTIPTGISNISPQDSADSVFCLDSLRFSWNHALDADGDNISYDLFYGTNPGSFTNPITSDSFYTAKDIKGGLKYYWYINVITKLDQIRCPAGTGYYMFTTKDNPAIISGFDDTSATINDTIIFDIAATDYEGIKEYRWDFNGDGTDDGTTTEPDTTHLYSDTGVYNAIVTVVDSVNNMTTDTALITITNDFPFVDANPGGDTIYINYTNDTIRLNPTASDDGKIVKYEWSFNGGSTYLDYTSTSGVTSIPADLSGLPKTLKYYFRATDEDGNPSTDSMYVYINMKWELSTSAPWIVDRQYFAVVSDDNAMYILGGWDDVSGVNSEVWKSTDGLSWEQTIPTSGYTPRYSHAAAIHNGSIFVAGGETTHDIWKTDDWGVTWDSIVDLKDIDNSYQSKLSGSFLASCRDTLFLIGGKYGVTEETNKVFYSLDGSTWAGLNSTLGSVDRFDSTSGFSAFVNRDITFQKDTIWILTDSALWHPNDALHGDLWYKKEDALVITGGDGLLIYNDIMYAVSDDSYWYSNDRGNTWHTMTTSGPWAGSTFQRSAVFNNKMWIVTDKGIWYSTDTP